MSKRWGVLGAIVANGNLSPLFPVFFGVWGVLALCSAGFFRLNKNANLKRKVWPPFVVTTSIVFIGFAWATSKRAEVLYVLVPAVALIALLSLRTVQFCNSCGATLWSPSPFLKPAFCSKCGASLQK